MFEGIFQPTHLLVILVIYLLFFGTKKLPELGKGLGEGIKGLRDALKETQEAAAGTSPAPAANAPSATTTTAEKKPPIS